jgi:hypothetical protein
MNNATTTRIDLGNNEAARRGITKNSDGTYTAMTFTRSRDFKTLKGAQRWLAKNTPASDRSAWKPAPRKPYGITAPVLPGFVEVPTE